MIIWPMVTETIMDTSTIAVPTLFLLLFFNPIVLSIPCTKVLLISVWIWNSSLPWRCLYSQNTRNFSFGFLGLISTFCLNGRDHHFQSFLTPAFYIIFILYLNLYLYLYYIIYIYQTFYSICIYECWSDDKAIAMWIIISSILELVNKLLRVYHIVPGLHIIKASEKIILSLICFRVEYNQAVGNFRISAYMHVWWGMRILGIGDSNRNIFFCRTLFLGSVLLWRQRSKERR